MSKRILRVFRRRTSHTPDDELVAIGQPGLFPPDCDEIHVSVAFTWDRSWAIPASRQWAEVTGKPVKIGGPACGGPVGDFDPGIYVKQGITYTTRGCPNHCPWCLVPGWEGALRTLPIQAGHTVQDNNLTAAPFSHFREVCAMLREQPRAATFSGGLEAARLTDEHLAELQTLRINEVWTAADAGWTEYVDRAISALRSFLPRRKVRCFVLVGFDPFEGAQQAADRLQRVWDAGALPFAQLYRGPGEAKRRCWPREWKDLVRKWSRPAAMVAANKEPKS